MPFAICPECKTHISDTATVCPHCGFSKQQNGELIPLKGVAAIQPFAAIRIPDLDIFKGVDSLVPASIQEAIAGLLKDGETLCRLAPAFYDAIVKLADKRGDTQFIADFSKTAEELMKKGEIVFSIDSKTGDLLPQLRSVETGRVYEKARIHIEDVPKDVFPSVIALQMQAMMTEVMAKIEEVAVDVAALRLENQADRFAKAEAVWQQLEQAARIEDARLRELSILGIMSSATEARCLLQGNYQVKRSLAFQKKGRASQWGEAANDALSDLTLISLMARAEVASCELLGESAAAQTALCQFGVFIQENGLDTKKTLLEINEYSKEDRSEILDSFLSVANNVLEIGRLSDSTPQQYLEEGECR